MKTDIFFGTELGRVVNRLGGVSFLIRPRSADYIYGTELAEICSNGSASRYRTGVIRLCAISHASPHRTVGRMNYKIILLTDFFWVIFLGM
jgi:hypothetical protein